MGWKTLFHAMLLHGATVGVVPATDPGDAELQEARPASSFEGPHEPGRGLPERLPGPPLMTDVPATPVCSQVVYSQGRFKSIQVNVDADGRNIPGDCANEPSLAVDPNNRQRMVIGWRQFDSVNSDFRQAGRAYTDDGGLSWAFPGVLQPGQFGSDPVVDSDRDGNFYYLSLQTGRQGFPYWSCFLYKSTDGGSSFGEGVFAYGGDKEWMVIDKTLGTGAGHIYVSWSPFASCCGSRLFARSTDGGQSFSLPVSIPRNPTWGTMTVAQDGALYIAGRPDGQGRVPVVRSTNARDAGVSPTFDFQTLVDMGGDLLFGGGVNPDGLLGQPWIAADRSFGPNAGNLYVCSSLAQHGSFDPMDVFLVRSSDRGLTWSTPVRVNDDGMRVNSWQWFAAMSVAPGGRIDVVWYDTRNDPLARFSQLFYAASFNGGETWTQNLAISPPFAPAIGYPGRPPQRKIGDYIQTVSDNEGVNIAYAATFNDEQDIYFIRVEALLEQCVFTAGSRGLDCNGNGIADNCEAGTTSPDVNRNGVPDECENDHDGDGILDAEDPDIDGDGFPNLVDICDYNAPGVPGLPPDGRPFGDVDRSCRIDGFDYEFLHFCAANGGPGVPGALRICEENFDFDADGDVDLFDVASLFRFFDGPPAE